MFFLNSASFFKNFIRVSPLPFGVTDATDYCWHGGASAGYTCLRLILSP